MVEIEGELAFAVDFEIRVSDPDRRIRDPEDKGRILLEAPVFQATVEDQEFERAVLLRLTLGRGDRLFVEELEFLCDSPLTIPRPQPTGLYEGLEPDL